MDRPPNDTPAASRAVMDVVETYREADMPDCVFAAAVPNNWDRQLGGLLAEVQMDQDEMTRRVEEQQSVADRLKNLLGM